MAWTYTGDPANNAVDKVRLLIGDTDPDDPQLSNEEISFFTSQAGGSAVRGAIAAVTSLIAKYARYVDTKIESIGISNQQRIANYQQLMQQLEEYDQSVGTDSFGIPFVGGVSVSEMEAQNENDDRTQSQFRTDMFRNPRVGSTADLDDRFA